LAWRVPLLVAGVALNLHSPLAGAYEPRINYMLQCMGCHTPDGSGEPGRVPSLKETLVPFASSAEGRRFLVQVPGASQSTLSDAELAKLLNWMIRDLSTAKPARFRHFTPTEVAAYRRTPLVNVREARERLLRSSAVTATTTH
jgi:hypothetical protein